MDNYEEFEEISNLLHQIIRLHFTVAQKQLDKHGLHPAQPGIIHMLSNRDGMTQVDLAGKLNVTPATISAMVKRMERDDLLYRKRSEEDQRVTHIYLTEKGKEQSIIIGKVFNQINQVSFKNFSEEDLIQVREIFLKIASNLKGV